MGLMVAKAVIRVCVPSSVAARAVVTSGSEFSRIYRGRHELFVHCLHRCVVVQVPRAIAPPKISDSVIAYFLRNVGGIVMFSGVSSPYTFTSVGSNAKDVMGAIVACHCITARKGLRSNGLLFGRASYACRIVESLTVDEVVIVLEPFHVVRFVREGGFPVPGAQQACSHRVPSRTGNANSSEDRVEANRYQVTVVFVGGSAVPSCIVSVAVARDAFFHSPRGGNSSPVCYPIQTRRELVLFRGNPCHLYRLGSLGHCILRQLK